MSIGASFNLAPRLAQVAQGKDNNFNLLRLLAALSVLFSHSFALLAYAEPFEASTHKSLGAMSVDVFFVASGFLVTASLVQRKDILDYAIARCLRIFPALWVMLLLSVFVLGLGFTNLDTNIYLSAPETMRYLWRNACLLFGVDYTLPGIFPDNHFRAVVNGSLWTMQYELIMYLLLAFVWCLYSALSWRLRRDLAFVISAGVLFLSAWILYAHCSFDPLQFLRLFWMFFIGSAYYFCRAKLALHFALFGLACCILTASLLINPVAFLSCYYLLLPYLLFYLVYVPKGRVRAFNRLGDYSYGVYIFAFPVQQSLIALFPHIAVWQLALGAGSITLALAILSWHGLEKRMMAQRFFLTSKFHGKSA
jgi:peptidoglycan/LPS O-acetylase OafA/YrhL